MRDIEGLGIKAGEGYEDVRKKIEISMQRAYKLGAEEATVSPMRTAKEILPDRVVHLSEVTSIVTAVTHELIPVIVKTMRENLTGYGSALRDERGWDTMAKSMPITPWKGPSERKWESIRLEVKKHAAVHKCIGIIDGTWTEPPATDVNKHKLWEAANTRAIILLSNMLSEYEESEEIIRLYTEESGLNGDSYECWRTLDDEFDDDGVYDRTILEEQYDNCKMQLRQNPSRFLNKLSNLRKKLQRVGLKKDDETFLYDIIKRLPGSIKQLERRFRGHCDRESY